MLRFSHFSSLTSLANLIIQAIFLFMGTDSDGAISGKLNKKDLEMQFRIRLFGARALMEN
jgi:hypothetical protein